MNKILRTLAVTLVIMAMLTSCDNKNNESKETSSSNSESQSSQIDETSSSSDSSSNSDADADSDSTSKVEYLPVNTGMAFDIITLDSLPSNIKSFVPVWYSNGEIVELTFEFFNSETKESRWVNAFAKEGEADYGSLKLQKNEILGRYYFSIISKDSLDAVKAVFSVTMSDADGMYSKKCIDGDGFHLVDVSEIQNGYIKQPISNEQGEEIKESVEKGGYRTFMRYSTGGLPYNS